MGQGTGNIPMSLAEARSVIKETDYKPTSKYSQDIIEIARMVISHEMRWHNHFMREASLWGQMSKDQSTKVGAVVVRNRRLISTGFNGFPIGIRSVKEGEVDRPTKYKYIVHAEENAIYNAAVNGISLKGACIYITGLPPCSRCAKAIIQVGIEEVIFREEMLPTAVDSGRTDWSEEWKFSHTLFQEVGIEVSLI